jgi:hypothetical protein
MRYDIRNIPCPNLCGKLSIARFKGHHIAFNGALRRESDRCPAVGQIGREEQRTKPTHAIAKSGDFLCATGRYFSGNDINHALETVIEPTALMIGDVVNVAITVQAGAELFLLNSTKLKAYSGKGNYGQRAVTRLEAYLDVVVGIQDLWLKHEVHLRFGQTSSF